MTRRTVSVTPEAMLEVERTRVTAALLPRAAPW